MAGRGTDIQLDGNKNLEKIENIKIDKQKVLGLGGLCIVGTERHESRRIDNQLRGRSGRQGESWFLSFLYKFRRRFNENIWRSIYRWYAQKLGLKQNDSINHPWINKAMKELSKK